MNQQSAMSQISLGVSTVGLCSGISMVAIALPAQALEIKPLDNFSYGSISVEDGKSSLFTTGTSFSIAGDSITVNGGAILSQLPFAPIPVPVGGAGYLYEATGSGSVTFDWNFVTPNSEAFFGFALFADDIELTKTLNALAGLDPTKAVPEDFYDNFTYELLADGENGEGQYTVNFVAGNIFGFGVALEGFDARNVNNLSLGAFRITSQPATSAPQEVPTPAAVLPVLGGLFAAAKRRTQSRTEGDLT